MITNKSNLIANDDRLFHKEKMDLDVITKVLEIVSLTETFVEVKVETLKNNIAFVKIEGYNDDTFRIMMSRKSNIAHETLIDYNKDELSKKSICVSEFEDSYYVRNGSTTLIIDKNLFNLKLVNLENKVLWELENSDKKSWCVTPAMGFVMYDNQAEFPVISYRMKNDEHFYGLGEKFSSLDKRNTKAVIWAADTMGTNTTDLSYKAIPVLFSNYNYGLIFNTTYKSHFELGTFSYPTSSVMVEEYVLDIFIWSKQSFKDMLSRYYRIIGKPYMVPKWALGIWMSKCSYNTNEEIEFLMNQLKEKNIPIDCINIDTGWLKEIFYHTIGTDACDFVWNDEKLRDRKELFKLIKSNGYHLCMWINPYIAEHVPLYEEASKKGYLVKNNKGGNARIESGEAAGLVDFTNPKAKEWWKSLVKVFLDEGMSCVKPDYADRTPKDAVFFNGKSGDEMHNIYCRYYLEAVDEIIYETKNEHIMFRRPGYLGTQKYGVTWAGDTQTSWSALKCVIRAGLSTGMCGEVFWSNDVGGFTGPKPSDDLYVRWAQYAMFTPIVRFHGTTPREPWNYSTWAEKIVTKYMHLRYKLLPYIYYSSKLSCQNGFPLMSALVINYTDDPAIYGIEDQYMFGESLMVAPVIMPETNWRYVYFPEGYWKSFDYDNKSYEGGRYYKIDAPIDRIPLFMKDGSTCLMRENDSKQNEYRIRILCQYKEAILDFVENNMNISLKAKNNNGKIEIELNHNISNLIIEILNEDIQEVYINGKMLKIENNNEIIIK